MNSLAKILADAKLLAREYRRLTGKPLGITGEVAEVSAAQLLGLTLADARQAGYDATRFESGRVIRIQIKGRCIPADAKPGQRLGSIRLDQEWDTVMLVLMNEDYEALSIYEAERPSAEAALRAPGSKARNERGALGIGKFKSIAREVWTRQ
jgi:hypothetical protein